MDSLAGTRILVAGASSGIGRAIAVACGAAGARVAVSARRADLLDALAAEIGDALAIPSDVREPDACERLVAEAASGLGGLDALVYASGISPLATLEQTDAALWRAVLETNLVGAALVTRAALPHLAASGGRAVYISSLSGERPWPGLVAYGASKSALDRMIEGWRLEHPEVSFTRLVPWHTLTDSARGWDPELAGRMMKRWHAEGFFGEPALMTTEQVAAETVGVLAAAPPLGDVRLPPPPA